MSRRDRVCKSSSEGTEMNIITIMHKQHLVVSGNGYIDKE